MSERIETPPDRASASEPGDDGVRGAAPKKQRRFDEHVGA
jgi:hypothetical protein